MPNLIYRNRLINNIQYAIREAENAAHVNHPGLTGLIRELVASQIFAHIMPGGFEIGKGKLIDRNGKLSSEGDLLVYNHSILPPIMYSERDGIYPIESSYYAFEIKSQSTASNIQDAIRKGRAIIELDYPTKEEKNNNRNASITVMVFFAFGSDLAKNSSEFDRYAKYDPDWKNDPVIKVICVVGSGYWYYGKDSSWHFQPPTDSFDEVLCLITHIVNSLLRNPPFTRPTRFGDYLHPPEDST
jgi:hypothetical protein